MHIIDGTTCLREVEQLIREYTQLLGRDLSFQKLLHIQHIHHRIVIARLRFLKAKASI